MKLTGTLVAAHGRHYRVRLDGLNSGETLACFPRGKKSELACGDKVSIERLNATQGVIDSILPRRSLLYRSNDFRQKLIAANVTQIIIVVATEPSFSDELVSRCLVAAHNQDIAALIVLNKSDLSERLNRASEALTAFVALGYPLLTLSAHADVTALRERLHGHVSVLIGQSGMGKSTLINALLPEAAAPVREISSALDSGTERAIQSQLEQVALGRTTLIIAHRLSTVMNADEIIVMQTGEIIERGTHTQLLAANGSYTRMWNLQQQEEDGV